MHLYWRARVQRQHHHPMKVSETPFRKLNGDPLRIFHSVPCRGLPPFHSIAASSHSGVSTRRQPPQCSDQSYPSGKPLSNDKAKPPSYHGKPSAISHGKPSSLKLYGLHLSQEEKEESAAAQQVEDSIAIAKQSSSDKSQEIIKSKSSVPFTAKLAIAVLMMLTAVAVIFFIRRYLAGRRRHFGHRLPNSLPGSSGGALFGGEDKPLHG